MNTLRKALILITISVLSTVNLNYKISIAAIILIISMRIQQRLRPYKDDVNNEIELKAIIASILTVTTGIIYIQDQQVALINSIMLVGVLIVNIWFIVEWLYLFSVGMKDKYCIFRIVSNVLLALIDLNYLGSCDFQKYIDISQSNCKQFQIKRK